MAAKREVFVVEGHTGDGDWEVGDGWPVRELAKRRMAHLVKYAASKQVAFKYRVVRYTPAPTPRRKKK
jgi:hypothetical protein